MHGWAWINDSEFWKYGKWSKLYRYICRQVDRWIGGRGEGRGEGGWLSGTEKDRTNRIWRWLPSQARRFRAHDFQVCFSTIRSLEYLYIPMHSYIIRRVFLCHMIFDLIKNYKVWKNFYSEILSIFSKRQIWIERVGIY